MLRDEKADAPKDYEPANRFWLCPRCHCKIWMSKTVEKLLRNGNLRLNCFNCIHPRTTVQRRIPMKVKSLLGVL